MRLQTKLYGWKAFPFDRECLWKESALGVRFENCHRKHLAVVWSKKGVHWQNWSCWPSHQTNWTCCGPVLPLVQTCILFFSWRLWMSYITMTKNKWSSNLEPKHTLLPVSCQHFWPSISFALVLISLLSRSTHLILLSTLTNPIFIFNLKISSYNPIFFLFHRIIEPLTSRCSKFRFKPLSTETLEKRLNMICKEENVNCDNKVWKDGLFWKRLKISTGGFNN